MRILQRIGLAEQLQREMLADRPVAFVDAAGRTRGRLTVSVAGSELRPPQRWQWRFE
jgi:3-(3-hydroxy-phenyl)propionate hydroxylase